MIYTLRPYAPSDAPSVVDVINADAARVLTLRRAALDGVGNVRLLHYVPPASEKTVAVDAAGQVVGFAYLADHEQHIVYQVGGAVHPDCWNQGIGAALLAWAETRAQELSQVAPAGVKTVLQIDLYTDEQRARHLVSGTGFAQVREWLHLQIDLNSPPPAPIVPAGLTLRPIDLDNDWDLLGPAMDAAYADHWGTVALPEAATADDSAEQDQELPEDESYSNAPGFCFLLRAGHEVAGGILCNARIVERPDSGRVGSLFVRPEYRRRGAGQALMLAAFGAFWAAGLRHVILDTDAGSFTQAHRLYTRLGMQLYRRELVYEKELRPGLEARRLT
ncbi:MAG: GNAT family N-acetyltransferase [Anaerolinea sp.]|nr:GNAT family N-acetyltransferase [Anaerolinea sp.]